MVIFNKHCSSQLRYRRGVRAKYLSRLKESQNIQPLVLIWGCKVILQGLEYDMNPLTLVKRIQKITSTEAALGITEDASWHAKYKESAYVFVGGIPFDLTEGDLLAVFAQYGEVVDVNLVRDKATGKSKGYAFLAYEDQRSTVLAVDNLNGAKVLGRIVRVDHVSKYKKKEEEDEEAEQQKREARGVCRAFQRGDCTRGASCKFSHNEQRSANTGWGPQDSNSKWGNDKYEGPSKSQRKIANTPSDWNLDAKVEHKDSKLRSSNEEGQRSRVERDYSDRKNYSDDRDRLQFQRHSKRSEREDGKRNANEKLLERHKSQLNQIEDRERNEKYSKRSGEVHTEEDRDRQRSVRQPMYDEDGSSRLDSRDRGMRGSEKQSRHKKFSSRYREEDDTQHNRERG